MSDLQAIPFNTLEHDGVEMHAFGGFPYLTTKVVPALHHILLLPSLEQSKLVHLALAQWKFNRMPMSLCLDWNESVFVEVDGAIHAADGVPYASLTQAGRIRPSALVNAVEPDAQRVEQLAQFIATIGFPPEKAKGFIVGSGTNGGWRADEEQLKFLSARGPTGAPFGLWLCAVCGEYRGTCLDPSPRLKGLVVRVTCRCSNDTRCAACGETFFEWRLNSNQYVPDEDAILYLSGTPALDHICGVN